MLCSHYDGGWSWNFHRGRQERLALAVVSRSGDFCFRSFVVLLTRQQLDWYFSHVGMQKDLSGQQVSADLWSSVYNAMHGNIAHIIHTCHPFLTQPTRVRSCFQTEFCVCADSSDDAVAVQLLSESNRTAAVDKWLWRIPLLADDVV